MRFAIAEIQAEKEPQVLRLQAKAGRLKSQVQIHKAIEIERLKLVQRENVIKSNNAFLTR